MLILLFSALFICWLIWRRPQAKRRVFKSVFWLVVTCLVLGILGIVLIVMLFYYGCSMTTGVPLPLPSSEPPAAQSGNAGS